MAVNRFFKQVTSDDPCEIGTQDFCLSYNGTPSFGQYFVAAISGVPKCYYYGGGDICGPPQATIASGPYEECTCTTLVTPTPTPTVSVTPLEERSIYTLL
jgi:hypothetical protein